MNAREILKKIRRIELKTRGAVAETFSGQYRSVFKGRGMNFEEVREYQPGDEVRTIDWNVTARLGEVRGEAFVKKFTEERELTVMLIVDVSASGEFGSVSLSKRELAAELACLLAFSAIRNSDKVGLIPSAEGGTLFLDEVADLPLHMQVKLLRVIQEKSVRPIGEQRESPVDVRILSATHKNLADLVAESRFREDLYYRINVIEIRVPPLRERQNDIRPLTEAILSKLSERLQIHKPAVSEAAWQMLESYAFPGNVRELENVLERAVTLSTSGAIEAEHIRLRAAPRTPSVPAPSPAPAQAGADNGGALLDQLEHVERDAIVKALEQTRYNKTAAAKLLGVTYRALRYKIKKLEIE